MAEKTSRQHKNFEERIPPETREHMKTAGAEMRKSLEAILPPGFMEHRRTARKEMLLAFRSLLDSAIEKMDEKGKKA
jgi:hypothetical protein